MSAVAGRVLLIPKGSYNSGITYNMLDVVTYEYDSYVAKTTTIGHDPTDTTYWQKMTDVGDDVNSLKETFTKNGAHNLLPLTLVKLKALNTGGTWSGNTYTWRGLTFEVNTDASGNVTSITANGTPSTSQVQFFITNHAGLENGEYILNGALSSSKRIFFYNGSQWFDDLGSGINFSVSGSETAQQVIITILEAVNNDVFYPMIKLASDPDSTFTPYAMTNRELTQAKLDVTQLKTVVAASSDFADFKTRIAAL